MVAVRIHKWCLAVARHVRYRDERHSWGLPLIERYLPNDDMPCVLRIKDGALVDGRRVTVFKDSVQMPYFGRLL
jgi:hypothetical protein